MKTYEMNIENILEKGLTTEELSERDFRESDYMEDDKMENWRELAYSSLFQDLYKSTVSSSVVTELLQ